MYPMFMVKVTNKTTRRKTSKIYVNLRHSRSSRSKGLTLEGLTLSQAYKAIAALDSRGTDSIGAQGRATDND